MGQIATVFEAGSLSDLPEVASGIISMMESSCVVCLYGPMGAGKTTLIREICAQLGVRDTVTSPTFALVNSYQDADGDPVYHFDFYRTSKPEEALDLGYEEYFASGYPCLVEWPERIGELIDGCDVLSVRIDVLSETSRRFTVTPPAE